MIPFDKATRLIDQHVNRGRVVLRSLNEAYGHVLAQEIAAREDIPLFDSSAMDGFAVRSADLARASDSDPVRLRVTGVMRAGDPPHGDVGAGEAMKILTGAVIPAGADTVVMKERAEENGDSVGFDMPAGLGDHIRRCGEEFTSGARVFDAGTLITPAVAGMLATLGYTRVRVHALPTVALLVTGSELRRPGARLKPGQIRDANTYALQSALYSIGIQPELHFVRDDREQLRAEMRAVLKRHDGVITTGGISVGDCDYVREIMHELGVTEHFWRVAMKPGKPVFFGTRGRRFIFSLPGNPVSALLGYYLFARRAIARYAGRTQFRETLVRARLSRTLRHRPGRMEFVRVRLETGSADLPDAVPAEGQGSHMLGGMAQADGLLRLPADAEALEEGMEVDVEYMHWSWS